MPKHASDRLDRAIFEVLQSHARGPVAELAERVGLSPSPCRRRAQALERQGVIRRYVALANPKALGLPVSVWVNVTLEKQAEERLEAFEAAILRRPEVMECYLMTGQSDYLLRVVVADVETYERFVLEHLTRIDGVASIKSSFALKQVQYKTALPLGHLPG